MMKRTRIARGGGNSGRGGYYRRYVDYFEHDDRLSQNCMVQEQIHRRPFKMPLKSVKTRLNFGERLSEFKGHDLTQCVEVNNGVRKVSIRERLGNSVRPTPIHRKGDSGWKFDKSDNWFKVTIPHVRKYGRALIMEKLLETASPTTFVPLLFRFREDDATFFVDSQKIARMLYSFSHKIELYNGFRLHIKVNSETPPQPEINDEFKERLRSAMEKRYLPDKFALNLSKFYEDPDLVEDFICAFCKPSILMAVLDIIEIHIPHLEALNLDNNKLSIIERLHVLSLKFPNLKILHIGDNQIQKVSQLNVLKELQLEELRVQGNPVCDRFKHKEEQYMNIMQNVFPKLVRLDGLEVHRPIMFDIEKNEKIPKCQQLYFQNKEAHIVASNFLQLYFKIFDSDNREALLQAYHEQACFSLTVPPALRTSPYYESSRNLCRVPDISKRQKLLKRGKLQIVTLLSDLPRTSHDLSSFTLDLTLITDSMMLVIVAGLFKELNSSSDNEVLRYFNRTFTIVPEGSGYCIKNEQLHICNPTGRQVNKSRKSSIVPQVSSLDEEIKQQMTLTLSQQTNMNLQWSQKCLEEVQWSYEKALGAFQECFKQGKVPAEAFVK